MSEQCEHWRGQQLYCRAVASSIPTSSIGGVIPSYISIGNFEDRCLLTGFLDGFDIGFFDFDGLAVGFDEEDLEVGFGEGGGLQAVGLYAS